jgi:hypothetical protein
VLAARGVAACDRHTELWREKGEQVDRLLAGVLRGPLL